MTVGLLPLLAVVAVVGLARSLTGGSTADGMISKQPCVAHATYVPRTASIQGQ